MASAFFGVINQALDAGKEVLSWIQYMNKRQDELYLESQLNPLEAPYLVYVISALYPNAKSNPSSVPKIITEKIFSNRNIREDFVNLINSRSYDSIMQKWKEKYPNYQPDAIRDQLNDDRLPAGYAFETLEVLGFDKEVKEYFDRFKNRTTEVYNSLGSILDQLAASVDKFIKDPTLLTERERIAIKDLNINTKQLREQAKLAREQKITQKAIENLINLFNSKFKIYSDIMTTFEQQDAAYNNIKGAADERSKNINNLYQLYK
jgi:hypothetical protein